MDGGSQTTNDGEDQGGSACTAWNTAECTGTPYCPPRCPRFFDRTGLPILVQPLQERDLDRLAGMYESIESSTLRLPPPTRERIERWLGGLHEKGWNLVARDDERIVGHVSVVPADDPTPEVIVFVHEQYHTRGIGTELIKQAIAFADERHHELTALISCRNRRSLSVFENLGFEVVDRKPDLWTRLSLDDPTTAAVQLPPAERPATE
ncbi:GNAT family N-acetyltransferase [Natrarchaeobius chitinivorans]|uniref:N-acetyltransferase n=1 Tax=Natrarchaeobius chitinivorans TaxID=1679083 RepID=A0A3N6LX05_NATCH|nr:GNAT family N-acetyltransferase [Natrarchaeobius chitinivorans]RQG95253.1 N-acetyltransferase [Natrarchaeobius chitinivorans]